MRTILSRFAFLFITVLSSFMASAQTPYAVLSTDGKTLSFYYDTSRGRRAGTKYEIPTTRVKPAWTGINTVTTIHFGSGFKSYRPTTMHAWFSDLNAVTSITNIENLVTDEVTDMDSLFAGCGSLTSVDLSGFNTEHVTTMACMFQSCEALTTLDLSSFDPYQVTDMSYMFDRCSKLTSMDLSTFDCSNVSNFSHMFNECTSLTSFDLSAFSTYTSVRNMSYMFAGCSKLASIEMSGNSAEEATDLQGMFEGCSSLASLDLSGFYAEKATTTRDMFSGCTALKSLDISGITSGYITDMGNMFYNCSSLTSIDLSHLNTSSVRTMYRMFEYCSSLTNIDVSKFDMSKCTDVSQMFGACTALQKLDISNWNWTQKKLFDSFCTGCTSLTELKVNQCNPEAIEDEDFAPFYGVGSKTMCRLYMGNDFNRTLLGNITIRDGRAFQEWGSGMFFTALCNSETQNALSTFQEYLGQAIDVMTVRTFKAGTPNTVCYPFALKPAELRATFGTGYGLYQLYDASTSGCTLHLYFTPVTTSLEAGTPYLLTVTSDVVNPSFPKRIINTLANNTPSVTYAGGTVTFHGTSFPRGLTNNDQNTLFLKDGTLYYPSVTSGNCMIYGMRGYFTIATSAAKPNSFTLTLDDDDPTTGIEAIQPSTINHQHSTIYNLQGQRVNNNYHGIVIRDGQKFINRKK